MEDSRPPITRDELLGGLLGRRVSTSLYAIERRVAYLAIEARHATAPAICERMAATQERAFLAALRLGRELPDGPSIQDLERFVSACTHLVPGDAAARAELAHRLGAKHRFRANDVPRLRATLGLDDATVHQAYRRRHGHDLDAVYATTLPPSDRRRWWWARLAARLEDLPPFWSAFSLTLTQTVGAGVLALPIAMAGVGPLPGLVLIVVLGLVNVLTVMAVAESFSRTGTVRWGGAYFGRVVTQHLGPLAGVVLSVTLAVLTVLALLAYYVGLASTLGVATGVPDPVWAAGLFLVTAGFVWRGRLEATVVSGLLVGAVNILIVLVLSVLAFGELEMANLRHVDVPFVGGRPFDPGILGLIFGVVLLAYFGHTAVANGARTVLRRDPSGRSLVRGTAAAMVTVIALYGVWTVAVGGAVRPARLATESGTALTPLAESLGAVVLGFGAVFVVLAMGMAAVHFSMGLHHQTVELLPWSGRPARLAGLVPLAGVFVAVEVLLLTGRESFTGALGFVGTLTAPLLIGIFPILLVVATRRRGDYLPTGATRWTGRTVVALLVYALYLGAVVAHGAAIWQSPIERLAAFVTAALVLAATVGAVRAGAFVPLATIEVRRDRDLGRDRLRVTANGRYVSSEARVEVTGRDEQTWAVDGAADLPERARAVTVPLEAGVARQLRVWAHEVDPSGATVPLPVDVSLHAGGAPSPLALSDGHAVVPLEGPVTVQLDLPPVGRDRVGVTDPDPPGGGG